MSATAAKGAFGRSPAEFEQMLEAKTYTWADIREAREAGRQEGSETLIDIVKEYREMGDSWPKAIGLGILASAAVLSVRWHIGSGIFRIGERITSLGEGVRSAQWDTSREQCWRDGHEFGLGMGLGDPEAAHWIEVEAQRRRLEERAATA